MLLTIIVPTFNRRDSLARGLSQLLPQVEAHRDQVALYVSDNCSDDGTEEFIRELQSKHPNIIQYKRQPQNLGAQCNFIDAVHTVDTKYVALISDDDLVLPGYVDIVLVQLKKYVDVGLVNYNALCVSPHGQYKGVRDPLVTFGHPKYYAAGGEFIKEHTHVPSLVSSNVFNRQVFVNTASEVVQENYPGYGWFAVLLKGIIRMPCVYIDQPLFLQYTPLHQRWEQNSAWYYAYGLSRLFYELDHEYAGIWDSWRYVFASSWFLDGCLEIIGKYQVTYSDRYEMLLKYSAAEEFSRKLKYYLFHSVHYRYFVLNLCPRILKRVRNILHV